MKELGWVEGQNLIVEWRGGESADQLRAAAKDLVRLQVDVIVTSGAGLAKAVHLETKTIPIVVQNGAHLVAAGQFLRRMLDASTGLAAWSQRERNVRGARLAHVGRDSGNLPTSILVHSPSGLRPIRVTLKPSVYLDNSTLTFPPVLRLS